ncbi:DNA-(apurinic or apyrimidinic site) lyase [Pandoraea thiooxydans]|uniref:Adenine DNA glycosylase n=1 Tax=Pandoraea thiooxydans TaxID=445709 RepID=A0A0G3EQ55_9BURK|nr:A/G-specific adenine glycosylase [Pandoraea thiooxydans]AKJ69213.1 A/G-specific adenine glycosylase [Pandoraea thiooxydans]APR96811.1 DNA-(apurinic or apyrimidinic site) lyase [Pandoraea thiooxydans]
MPPSSLQTSFAPRLIAWQQRHGRHDLPWQNTTDAYRIWLSEIMLQQTQVATVIPYYERFLRQFPTVAALAAAPQDAVMALWSGLGYYSRARNLHRCAQHVVDEYDGQFPRDVEALARLPGIGRSTAAAIAAFAYGAHAAILDGNVKRVLTRVFGIEGYPGETRVERELWQLADALLPGTDLQAYTQGVMDLGATVCVRGKPLCSACPFADDCVARATGRERLLPTGKPRKTVPEKHCDILVMCDGERVLFERRPDSGIWGGLWSLPEFAPPTAVPGESVSSSDIADAAGRYGQVREIERMAALSHTFTHFKLNLQPWLITLTRASGPRDTGQAWLAAHEIAAAGLPAPIRRIALALKGNGKQLSFGLASAD